MNRRWRGIPLGCSDKVKSVVGLLPLILGSVLIALLGMTTAPAPTYCFFQSPISPPGTESPVSTPPVLTSVRTPLNFIPWAIGLLVIIVAVGLILYWRSRRKGGEEST